MSATPRPEAFAEPFDGYAGRPTPGWEKFTQRAQYLTMRDGVRLAVDLFLPGGLPAETRLPTLLNFTRYWRQPDLRAPFRRLFTRQLRSVMGLLTSHGYAVILGDVRGSGASFGSRSGPWSFDEVADLGEVAAWAASQPWSNGAVGAFGTSYAGTTAELLAANDEPAIRAVIPRFNEFDLYTDIALPGGIYLQAFVQRWSALNEALDANSVSWRDGLLTKLAVRGVKPVDGPDGRRLLREAVAGHRSNVQAATSIDGATFRDDVYAPTGRSVDTASVHTFRARIEHNGTPLQCWGGWMDAGTADAVIRRFLTFSNPQVGIIGPFNHGATQNADPFVPPKTPPVPAPQAQWMTLIRFCDHHLQGIDNGVNREKTLIYYTMGEGKWKRTPVWPPAGQQRRRHYLAAGGALQPDPPAAQGHDRYRVDYTATTGTANRWHTQFGGQVRYRDRAPADALLLKYDSPPLPQALEITGYPIVTVQLATTATDGALFVYLEAVAPDRWSFYLTEGQLRFLHRRLGSDPPYRQLTPYHSFRRADALPVVANENMTLRFGLQPLSVRIPAGYRLRLALAGADADTFAPLAQDQAPSWTITRSPAFPSFIDLPIMPPSG